MLKAEYDSKTLTTTEWLAGTMKTVAPSTREIVFPVKVCSELTGRLGGTAGP